MKRLLIALSIFTLLLSPQFLNAENGEETYEETESYEIGVRSEAGEIARTLEVSYEGIVPCGRCLSADGQYSPFLDSVYECPSGTTYIPCSFCHTFIMFDRIVSFVLGMLIPAVALIVIVGAGVIMITSAGNPERTKKAKDTLIYAVAGMFLAYFSLGIISIIISTFMDWDLEWGVGRIETQHMCDLEIEEDNIEVD